MTKQDYFEILFKRDFITHVLLQKPRFDDQTVSAKLRTNIDKDFLYNKLKSLIPAVLVKFLSEDIIRDNNGRIVSRMPEGLNNDIIGKVVNEFRISIEREIADVSFIPQIIAHVERLTWAQGIDDMIHNLLRFKIELQKLAEHYNNVNRLEPSYYDLDGKYEDARRVTIRERFMSDNYKDVKVYFDSLTKYCKELCEEEIVLYLSRLYGNLAKAHEIDELIDKYKRLMSEATEVCENLAIIENHPEWDKEYQSIFPTDFYNSNIGAIDATTAFQMAFIQLLAGRESVLKEEGFLDDNGELVLYTNPRFEGLRKSNIHFPVYDNPK